MICAVAIVVIGLFAVTIAGPLCYQCDHVTTPADCHKGVQCSDNQRCFTQKMMDFSNNTYYRLGCENEHVCKTVQSASLIGKRDVLDYELQHGPDSRHATHMSLCLQCCEGDACNNKGCGSVDGQWSEWGAWSSCSDPKRCGFSGHRTMTRTCTNPAPAHGGQSCLGTATFIASCDNYLPCPVDAQWSEWAPWSACSVPRACGLNGFHTKTRTCAGQSCVGKASFIASCDNLHPCPVDAQWSDWAPWSACSVPSTCGLYGFHTKTRTCAGQSCVGKPRFVASCDNLRTCPVDAQWSEWGPWSPCSVPRRCGYGHHTKTRTCAGQSCVGKAIFVASCGNNTPCPVDGQWSEWGAWSSCSHTCGHDGQQSKQRNCTNPAPANGGHYCSGAFSTTRACHADPCPVSVGGHWVG